MPVLNDYLAEKGQDLNKTLLTRGLAQNLARKIEHEVQRKETDFGNEIVKINNIVTNRQ